MPSLASAKDPSTYHVLSYGTLLGSTLFQSFLAGPIAFTSLPRAQFSTLQQKIFPPYFSFQTAIPAILALTFPGSGSKAVGDAPAVNVGIGRSATEVLNERVGSSVVGRSGWRGLLEEGNMWTGLVPIGVMFGTAVLNLVLFGPLTTKVMKERKHQETRDGKKYYDPGPKSAEMEKLNTSFAWLHGASSLSNMIGLGAMVYYGIVLAEKL